MKISKTKRLILELSLDDFIVLRAALNKFQLARYRTWERLAAATALKAERAAILAESTRAKALFDAIDRQWNDYRI